MANLKATSVMTASVPRRYGEVDRELSPCSWDGLQRKAGWTAEQTVEWSVEGQYCYYPQMLRFRNRAAPLFLSQWRTSRTMRESLHWQSYGILMDQRYSTTANRQFYEARFPTRAYQWHLRSRPLTFYAQPLLMGIVNVTPDSFSDGGKFLDTQAAIEQGLSLVEQGADILDIGGESTRPYSASVALEEELQRVLPVVQSLCEQTQVPISIDTSKARVAAEAVAAGAEIINDVTGLEGDPDMLDVASKTGAGLCVMHMQGTPQTMQDDPNYGNVVEEVFAYLKLRRDALVASGIRAERICLDPGIGFGKTHGHNLALLAGCRRFLDLGQPILIGHSRKGFIGHLLGDKQADRTAANIGVALAVARQGVQVIRVHDVLQVKQALLLFDQSGGITGR